MPEGGDFVSFFRPGGRSFALKNCPQGGDFDGKISGPEGGGEEMVTGQIDTHKLRSNQAQRTKCLRQDVEAISLTED